jgi:hypothetical protein
MDRPGANALRAIGIVLTWLPLLGLAIYAISLPYFSPSAGDQIELSPTRAVALDAAGTG